MVMDRGALWIQVDPPVDAIVRLDVVSGQARPAVPGGHSVESGPEGLWVVGEDWLARVDPADGSELLRVDVGGDFALGGGYVWIFNREGLHQIDPDSGKVVAVMARGVADLCYERAGVVVAFDSAWLACKEGKVLRLALPSAEVTEIATDGGSHTFAVTDTAVWVTNYISNTVSRIDPRTNRETRVRGVGAGIGITTGDGYVWASSGQGIAKIDPATASVAEILNVGTGAGGNLYELVWENGIIWASTRSERVLRIDPST